MYDELFGAPWSDMGMVDIDLVDEYLSSAYDPDHGADEWFAALRVFSIGNGYASMVKEYKKNPEGYRGHIGHICDMIRYVATSQTQSPDLYSILSLLGKDRLAKRLRLYRSMNTQRYG